MDIRIASLHEMLHRIDDVLWLLRTRSRIEIHEIGMVGKYRKIAPKHTKKYVPEYMRRDEKIKGTMGVTEKAYY